MLLSEYHVPHLRSRLAFTHSASPPPIFDSRSLRPRDDAAHRIPRRGARAALHYTGCSCTTRWTRPASSISLRTCTHSSSALPRRPLSCSGCVRYTSGATCFPCRACARSGYTARALSSSLTWHVLVLRRNSDRLWTNEYVLVNGSSLNYQHLGLNCVSPAAVQ